jgi:hypothetical protein
VYGVRRRGDSERNGLRVDTIFFKGEGEQIGVLIGPLLGGLSTTPSSKFPFEKSIAAEAASIAEPKTKGLEYEDTI